MIAPDEITICLSAHLSAFHPILEVAAVSE
jgi:hypothetical protein